MTFSFRLVLSLWLDYLMSIRVCVFWRMSGWIEGHPKVEVSYCAFCTLWSAFMEIGGGST